MTRPRPLVAVVDDEEPVRRALRRLMTASDFDVLAFSSGADFLESLEEVVPDCLVLDLHMPGINGFELQARLSDLGTRIPVVVVTGHDLPRACERVMAAGACAYLRKPVDAQALLDAIAVAIASGGKSGPKETKEKTS